MPFRSLILGAVLLSASTLTLAREAMAKYGEYYLGPKTMTVELAKLASGTQALIKVYGVDHAWDGKVLRVDVRSGRDDRSEYYLKVDGKDYVMMLVGQYQAQIYLPGLGESYLQFKREESLSVQPEHLMTEYEQYAGK